MIKTSWIGKLLGLAGLAALGAALAAPPARAAFDDIYSAGHGDINLSYDSGPQELHLNYEFGSNAVINGVVLGAAGAGEREADTITTFLNNNTLGTGSAGLPAPFAGNDLYTLPQTSQAGKPFLGIGAETIDPGVFLNDSFTFSLTGFVQRPAGGEFILYQLGSEGTPFMNSADGISAADFTTLGAGGHDHYVFGFTSPGTYDVNFTASGTLPNSTVITTSGVFRFQVLPAVPEPSSLALAGLGGGMMLVCALRRRRAKAAAEVA